MSKAFDSYYHKSVKHDWKAHLESKTAGYNLVEADETIVRSYNEIWQPAVDFVSEKLSNLPTESDGTSDKWFLEALQGVLMDNKLRAEETENTDNKTIRQKIDGLTSKMDSMLKDAPSGEVATYIETFSSGMKSFKNRIDAMEGEPPPAAPGEAPPEGEAAPEGGEPPAKDGAAAPAPEGGQPPANQPPPDQNSSSTLLKDLNLA